jgi:hypothetical protein
MDNKRFKILFNSEFEEDKYVTIKLEQSFDTLDVLSLKLTQTDVYRDFNANYGVLVGRVVANEGIGIPNAKISIFIPIDEEDKTNSDILSVYPFETPNDVDNNNVKYNLLPRVSQLNPFNDIDINDLSVGYTPVTPVGTFPTKYEILANETQLEVYKKYYKFTTVTNQFGDYMLFGVPVGLYTVHMSVDITDIGRFSMTPPTMITNLGYSENLFTENGTKIKTSRDLETLPNVQLQNVAVNIRPFWGDTANFEIGITRQDFKIRAQLITTFTLFGNVFTDGEQSSWGNGFNDSSFTRADQMDRITDNGGDNVSLSTKRIGIPEISIVYIPNNISDDDIANDNYDPVNDTLLLDKSLYTEYLDNGVFCLIIPCNRRKIVFDSVGNEIEIDPNDNRGVFTQFRGFIIVKYGTDVIRINATVDNLVDNGSGAFDTQTNSGRADRTSVKIPQQADEGDTFNKDEDVNTDAWRRQHKLFEYGNFYTVAKFNALSYKGNDAVNDLREDPFTNSGVITNFNFDQFSEEVADFPWNSLVTTGSTARFGAEWINFSVYLPQFSTFFQDTRDSNSVTMSTNVTIDDDSTFYRNDNTQAIGGGLINTRMFLRSDRHYTDFVQVPKNDIAKFLEYQNKGFSQDDIENELGENLVGDYKVGGKIGGIPGGADNTDPYFYKGFSTADCIQYLRTLNLI